MKEYILSVPTTYILYILIITLVPLLIRAGVKKNSRMHWIIAWLILTLIAGFRYNTGQDWKLYENAYTNLVYHGGNFLKGTFNIEASFKLFSWISYILMGNSLLLFLLNACLTNFFALSGIYRFKDFSNPVWATFIYTGMLYFIQFNLGRQFLAMMIILFATKEIMDRRFIRFFVLILFASLFHSTALLIMPLYFYGISAKKNTIYTQLFNMLFYLLPVITLLIINPLLTIAYKILGNSKYNSYTISHNIRFGWGMLLQVIMLLLIFLCVKEKKYIHPPNISLINILLRIYVSASVFFFLQYIMNNFGGRIYLYFIPCEILLLGFLFSNLKLDIQSCKIKGNIYQLLLFITILVDIIHGFLTNSQGHVPYGFRYF